jgi:hypothetical protein
MADAGGDVFRSSGNDRYTPNIYAQTTELLKGGVEFIPVIPAAINQNALVSAANHGEFQLLVVNQITGAVVTEAQLTTAPTITIEQYSRSTGVYTARVSAASMLKISGGGGFRYAYDFPGATWNRGDLARITISGGVATISSKTYTFKTAVATSVVGLAELLQKMEADILSGRAGAFSSLVSQGNIASYKTITAGAVGDDYGTNNWTKLIDAAAMPAGMWTVASVHMRTPSVSKTYQWEIGYGDGTDSGTTVIARGSFTTGSSVTTPYWPHDFAHAYATTSSGQHLWMRARSDAGGGSFGVHVEVGVF